MYEILQIQEKPQSQIILKRNKTRQQRDSDNSRERTILQNKLEIAVLAAIKPIKEVRKMQAKTFKNRVNVKTRKEKG